MKYIRFTKEEKEKIIQQIQLMASKGVSDIEITRQLKISNHLTQKTTTKYWADKMKKADQLKNNHE